MAAEGKIPQPHILYIIEPAANLLYGPLGHSHLIRVKYQPLKEIIKGGNTHIHKFSNGFAPYFNIIGLFPQTAPLALTAYSLARITGQQILVLYLVAHGLHHLKKRCNAGKHAVPVPQEPLLLFCKFRIRFMDREIKFMGTHYELLKEFPHNLTPPARYSPLINGKGCIRDHKALINSNNTAIPSANRTCPYRVIVTEHQFCRLLKPDTVRLKNI